MNHRNQLQLIIISTLAACLFSGCQPIMKRGEKPSADWSRSIPLGQSVTGSVDLSVEKTGERAYMIWTYDNGDGPCFHYIQLDQESQVAAENDLDFPGQL